MRSLLFATAVLLSVPAVAGRQPINARQLTPGVHPQASQALQGAFAPVLAASEPLAGDDDASAGLPRWARVAEGEQAEAGRHNPRFSASAVTIDGSKAVPAFADLELLPDGSYRLGAERGHYLADRAGLKLEGPGAQWGRGLYLADADTITFRFYRGRFLYELTFQRARP